MNLPYCKITGHSAVIAPLVVFILFSVSLFFFWNSTITGEFFSRFIDFNRPINFNRFSNISSIGSVEGLPLIRPLAPFAFMGTAFYELTRYICDLFFSGNPDFLTIFLIRMISGLYAIGIYNLLVTFSLRNFPIQAIVCLLCGMLAAWYPYFNIQIGYGAIVTVTGWVGIFGAAFHFISIQKNQPTRNRTVHLFLCTIFIFITSSHSHSLLALICVLGFLSILFKENRLSITNIAIFFSAVILFILPIAVAFIEGNETIKILTQPRSQILYDNGSLFHQLLGVTFFSQRIQSVYFESTVSAAVLVSTIFGLFFYGSLRAKNYRVILLIIIILTLAAYQTQGRYQIVSHVIFFLNDLVPFLKNFTRSIQNTYIFVILVMLTLLVVVSKTVDEAPKWSKRCYILASLLWISFIAIESWGNGFAAVNSATTGTQSIVGSYSSKDFDSSIYKVPCSNKTLVIGSRNSIFLKDVIWNVRTPLSYPENIRSFGIDSDLEGRRECRWIFLADHSLVLFAKYIRRQVPLESISAKLAVDEVVFFFDRVPRDISSKMQQEYLDFLSTEFGENAEDISHTIRQIEGVENIKVLSRFPFITCNVRECTLFKIDVAWFDILPIFTYFLILFMVVSIYRRFP